MAFFDTTWYVNFGDGSTTGYWAVPKRPQNTAVVAGQLCRQFTAPAVGSERVFVCVIAGTTANTTDAGWAGSPNRGTSTSDGTVTWKECTGASAVNGDLANTPSWNTIKGLAVSTGQIIKRNNGASYQFCALGMTAGSGSEPAFSDTAGVTTNEGAGQWVSLGPVANFTGGQAPHARLANALAANWFASGNTVYVGDNHAETQSAAMGLGTSSALVARILCHNHSGSYPPAASDITTGASVFSATSLTLSAQGSFYFYGITFGTSAGTAGVSLGASSVGQTQNWYYFDNCSIQPNSNGAMLLGATSTAWGIIVFNNTTVRLSTTAAYILPSFCQLLWQNTGQILASGSSIPTTLFQHGASTNRFNTITLRNLDLSQLTGSLFTNASNSSIGTLTVQDCKLNAAMTVTTPINSGMNVQLIRSDSAATAYKSTRYQYEGTETTETSIVRTGGAVDPTGQAQSRKIVTSANAQWLRPFKAEPMAIYNSVTGSAVTATVCGIVDTGALPANDDIWAEFEYLGSATDPKGAIVTTTKASVLASSAAVASDSSTWAAPATIFDGVNSGVTLSGGNLIVTSGGATNSGAISAAYRAAGKYYFEIGSGTSGVSAQGHIGVQGSDFISGTFSGSNFTSGLHAVSLAFAPSGANQLHSNGASTGIDFAASFAGDVYCFALDLTARLAWVRKNNGNWNMSGSANPATGVGGVVMAAAPLTFTPAVRLTLSGGAFFTGNFGATSYAFTVPLGYGKWTDDGYVEFKLATTITPQLPGYIHARVRAAKISSTYYIDPKVTLT